MNGALPRLQLAFVRAVSREAAGQCAGPGASRGAREALASPTRSPCAALLAAVLLVPGGSAESAASETVAEQPAPYTNLQVLPTDMSREQLSSTMLDFLQGLGLPRRAGEGCLHCHEGSLDTPRSEWDFASDARPAKAVARRMISMVQAINDEHLGGLGRRAASTFRVGCETCHAGRVDPRPLLVRLTEEYEAGGTASAVELYRDLRRRFFGADAYDFRVDVLGRFADGLAERGRYDDARAFAEANEEAFPDDPVARRYTVRLGIQRALDERGAAAAVMEFERMRESEPPEVMVLGILDAVGWRTFRLGRETDALVLFRANRAAFPDEYFTFESLNEALAAAGEISRAELVRRYEAWLVEHPGHEMAKAQLTNSRRRR